MGPGDEKTLERRNHETEKTKISGEQRQSGCQKTKNRLARAPVFEK
jgi:hypothetical protein